MRSTQTHDAANAASRCSHARQERGGAAHTGTLTKKVSRAMLPTLLASVATLLASVATLVAFAAYTLGQAPPPPPNANAIAQPVGEMRPIREIFVPFEDLNVLLESPTRHMFLTREQYEELLAKAKAAPVDNTPLGASIVTARYEAVVEQARLRFVATLEIDVLKPGVQAVSLDLAGVGVRRATLDGASASLARNEQGGTTLFVEGLGRKKLTLEMVAPLETSAAEQTAAFQLPTPSATRLTLTAPGNAEVKNGVQVISREVDAQANVTRFELLPKRGPVQLALSLNSRQLRDQSVVLARSVLVNEITEAYERLHATVSLGILHGAASEFRFAVPDGFEVTDVASPLLARFVVEKQGEQQLLTVTLREPARESVVMNISAIKTPARLSGWSVPKLVPLDTAGQVAVVGILLEDRLHVSGLSSEDLIPIDNQVLTAAIPESVFRVEPGAPRIRPIAAYYSPQAGYRLSAEFNKAPARLLVESNLLLGLDEQKQTVRGRFVLSPEREKLFETIFTVPPGWHVAEVTWGETEPLTFERFAVGNASRVRVRMPRGVVPGERAEVLFRATSTPGDWLGNWDERKIVFPIFSVEGAERDTGAIAVRAVDDLAVRPESIEGLTPLKEGEKEKYGLAGVATDLVYFYGQPKFAATLLATRTPAKITARTYSFLRLSPEGLSAHYELSYNVERARTRRLSLLLPASTPASVKIVGLDGLEVKEQTSEVVGDQRRWTALLAEARSGLLRLNVDFEDRLPEGEPKGYELPLVVADGVAYESATVAVEGHSELDINVDTTGRKTDVGTLAGASYRVGRRLLGAYSFLGSPDPVRVDLFRRPVYGLPPAIVERAELVTAISTTGLSQTAARYQLRTKAAFLEVQLPPNSSLWAILLGGQPTKPQREKESLLISLPGASAETLRDLRIVYETPIDATGAWGRLATAAPKLMLRDDDGSRAGEVPVADLKWHLELPSGYRIVREAGSVFSMTTQPRPLAATRVVNWLPKLTPTRFPGSVGAKFGTPSDRSVGARADAAAEMRRFGVNDGESKELMTESLPRSVPAQEPASAQVGKSAAASTDYSGVMLEGAGRVLRNNVPDKGKKSIVLGGDALHGVGSLKIDVARQQTGERVTFSSLGVDPRLDVTLIDDTRGQFAAWAVGLLVALLGIVITPRRWKRKIQFVVVVLVAATVIPLLTGWIHELGDACDMAFFAACALIPYYLVAAIFSWAGRRVGRLLPVRVAVTGAAVLMLAATAWAQQPGVESGPHPAGTLRDVDLDELLPLLAKGGGNVKLPDDAVIIPYNGDETTAAIQKAEKVLVPYDKYVELWNRAYPDRKLNAQALPAPFTWAGAEYQATLEGGEFLLVRGVVWIELFGDDPVSVPLPIEGGVLAQAMLDGKPALLRVIQTVAPSQPAPQPQVQAPAQPNAAAAGPIPDSIVALQASGKGRKKLEFDVRLRLERRGGWRIAAGRLPASAATSLVLRVPSAGTEVRLSGVDDRSTYDTKQDGETIETAPRPDGRLSVQWRPQVAEAEVDQSLTAQSSAVLDIQEDGVRMMWKVALEFRRSRRNAFSVDVPREYLVERVVGANVRGWEAKPGADGLQRVELTLLKEVSGSESFTIVLSRRVAVGRDAMSSFVAPTVRVVDAALHHGVVQVRRSPLLEIRAPETAGLVRTDLSEPQIAEVVSAAGYEESPLGIRSFQAFRFAATPFDLRLATVPVTARATAELQTVLRIAEDEVGVESRIQFQVEARPIHAARLIVPAEMRIDRVTGPESFEWAVRGEGERRELAIYLATGQQRFAIVLHGRLPRTGAEADVTLPRLEVMDVADQEGTIAVQIDPAFSATATDLKECEAVLQERVHGWLLPAQRRVTQLALEHRSANYGGRIRVVAERPEVRALSVTNVKVTERTIEETILIDFTVSRAGIRELSFLIPDWLQQARIEVPMLRQKTVSPAEKPANYVRVRLQLQDDVMGQVQVLVQHDRLLSGDEQTAPLPIIETGDTMTRFVVMESAGRDEVVYNPPQGLEPLGRLESQRRILAKILSNGVTQAYVVRRDTESPRFTYHTKPRATVDAIGARISKAETILVVDGGGAYRAQVEFRVNNDTEQFLTIRLPRDASAWTATVAGEPVKPTLDPSASDSQLVRIPLIKTSEGDLDYSVVVKYGGKLRFPTGWQSVPMPLVKTANINVEFSQVRLRLPHTHRWMNFGGTMSRLLNEGDYRSFDIMNLNEQYKLMRQGLSSDNPFTSLRCATNLKQLDQSLEQYREYGRRFGDNRRIQQQLAANDAIRGEAAGQVASASRKSGEISLEAIGNGGHLWNYFQSQSNERSRNIVQELDSNFDAPVQLSAPQASTAATPAAQPEGEQQFNSKWLMQNRLQNPNAPVEGKPAAKEGSKSVSRLAAKGEQAEQSGRRAKLNKLDYGGELDAKQSIQSASREGQPANAAGQQGQSLEADVQRYQRQLEDEHAAQTRSRADIAGEPGKSASTSGVDSLSQSPKPGDMGDPFAETSRAGVPSGGGFGMGGMGGGMAERGGAAGMGGPSTSTFSVQPPESGQAASSPELYDGRPQSVDGDAVKVVVPGNSVPYLSSLDVNLPLAGEGRDYFFTVPRGDISISAVAVPIQLFDRAVKLLAVAGICLAAWVLTRMTRSFVRAAQGIPT